MELQIYSLLNTIIVALKNYGINIHSYSLMPHMTMFILKTKLKEAFQDVEKFNPKH